MTVALDLDLRVVRPGFRLDVALRAAAGERIGVLGASGSGKSTLLDAIAGFVEADGRVRLQGRDMDGVPPGRRPVDILFQDGNLLPGLTVARNVGLALSPRTLSAADRARVASVLEAVGLDEHADRRPARLSGGQRTRAALARILRRERPVVLMDEPFSALDPALRSDMMDLTRQLLGPDRTLVLVTHDLREAAHLCTRLVLLREGRVVLDGGAEALLSDPPTALRPWT